MNDSAWGYTPERVERCRQAFGDWFSSDLWKHIDDLRRYDHIIRETKPELIIETGTNTGASASWMGSALPTRPKVITIDTDGTRWNRASDYGIVRIEGSSVDPAVVGRVREIVRNWDWRGARRVMVSLDSDHSAAHVRREIELYAPLVTSGCYLVVEDGIFSWLNDAQWYKHGCADRDGNRIYDGNPLDAISYWSQDLYEALGFQRDHGVEFAYPVTMNPAGWWRRA